MTDAVESSLIAAVAVIVTGGFSVLVAMIQNLRKRVDGEAEKLESLNRQLGNYEGQEKQREKEKHDS